MGSFYGGMYPFRLRYPKHLIVQSTPVITSFFFLRVYLGLSVHVLALRHIRFSILQFFIFLLCSVMYFY